MILTWSNASKRCRQTGRLRRPWSDCSWELKVVWPGLSVWKTDCSLNLIRVCKQCRKNRKSYFRFLFAQIFVSKFGSIEAYKIKCCVKYTWLLRLQFHKRNSKNSTLSQILSLGMTLCIGIWMHWQGTLKITPLPVSRFAAEINWISYEIIPPSIRTAFWWFRGSWWQIK